MSFLRNVSSLLTKGVGINTRRIGNYSLSLKLNEVFIETFQNKGRIILNRPEDQNSLSISVVNQIFPVLKQWQDSKALVIIKGTGSEAFCGGNDVRGLIEAELKGELYAKKFFQVSYSINALIANYKIPIITLMNGLTSGDGAGLSVHSEYSVVTEKSIFSLPHCSYGFFPDMGATFFLPRLRGEIGRYLALTGHPIYGRDIQRLNLATHYCESGRIYDLEKDLELCENHDDVINTLRRYEPRDNDQLVIGCNLEQINYCFGASTVEDIIDRLTKDQTEWGATTLREMSYMSPLMLKVTLEALNRGKKLNLKDCLNMEYSMSQIAVSHKDLFEGVRAKYIDCDNQPAWRPSSLDEVNYEHIQAFFPKTYTKTIP